MTATDDSRQSDVAPLQFSHAPTTHRWAQFQKHTVGWGNARIFLPWSLLIPSSCWSFGLHFSASMTTPSLQCLRHIGGERARKKFKLLLQVMVARRPQSFMLISSPQFTAVVYFCGWLKTVCTAVPILFFYFLQVSMVHTGCLHERCCFYCEKKFLKKGCLVIILVLHSSAGVMTGKSTQAFSPPFLKHVFKWRPHVCDLCMNSA